MKKSKNKPLESKTPEELDRDVRKYQRRQKISVATTLSAAALMAGSVVLFSVLSNKRDYPELLREREKAGQVVSYLEGHKQRYQKPELGEDNEHLEGALERIYPGKLYEEMGERIDTEIAQAIEKKALLEEQVETDAKVQKYKREERRDYLIFYATLVPLAIAAGASLHIRRNSQLKEVAMIQLYQMVKARGES